MKIISVSPVLNVNFKSGIIPFNKEKKMTQKQNNTDLNNTPNSVYSKIEIKRTEPITSDCRLKHTQDTYTACLLGGAIGDALGWPVEFWKLDNIKSTYGKEGITDLKLVHNKAEITDDTQMTIFTADGLLKSALMNFDKDRIPNINTIFESYKDWLNTQYGRPKKQDKGWVSQINDLYASRAPGGTCLRAIGNNIPGTIEKPINNSKGCGGVMRVAPAGLMYYENPQIAFEVGARCAALTHGHPGGYLPAGVLAATIANIVQGKNLEDSINNTIEILKNYEGCEDTLCLLEEAKQLAASDISPKDAIKQLGEGWCGDEAIAISVYCALKSPDNFEKALIMAVNHDGDSDSTGAITGNILGAYLGLDNIPKKWTSKVELSSELKQIATDLYVKPCEIDDSENRYKITQG